MNKTYADGNVNVNYAFSFLLSSLTKGIMTLPIFVKGVSVWGVKETYGFETGLWGKRPGCLRELNQRSLQYH